MFLVTNFYHLLEVDMASDENAQATTYTQRHMNNPWSEMISCSPCFAFYYFSSLSWFIQTTWDISYPSYQRSGLILTLLLLMSLSLRLY